MTLPGRGETSTRGGAIQQSRDGAGRRLGPVELAWIVLPSKVFKHSYFLHKYNLEKKLNFHILCEEDWSRLPKTLFIFSSGQNCSVMYFLLNSPKSQVSLPNCPVDLHLKAIFLPLPSQHSWNTLAKSYLTKLLWAGVGLWFMKLRAQHVEALGKRSG